MCMFSVLFVPHCRLVLQAILPATRPFLDSSDSASSLLPQARNKPKEAPTAPAPAPFFLPTVGGPSTLQRDVQFALHAAG